MGMKSRKKLPELKPGQRFGWIWEYKKEPGIYYGNAFNRRVIHLAEAKVFATKAETYFWIPRDCKPIRVIVTVEKL